MKLVKYLLPPPRNLKINNYELRITNYELFIGVSTFSTCYRCHHEICHSPTNWIKNPSNPVWGNRNTDEFIIRLRLGYQLLYGGIKRV